MTHTERALQLRPVIEKASQSLDDSMALTAMELFPSWEELVKKGQKAPKGFRFRHGNVLYRTEQPEHTFVSHYIPGSAGFESLFSKVDESHAGSIKDPIPFSQNMEIYQGLYYIQNDVLYHCIRSSGQPLYHDLALLVGSYVEVVNEGN